MHLPRARQRPVLLLLIIDQLEGYSVPGRQVAYYIVRPGNAVFYYS